MADFLPVYSLTASPYEVRVLNPLSSATDASLLIRVAGFKELDRIDHDLQAAVQSAQPVFFMVTGRDGCGRSSAANYILARYCHFRGISPTNFIVPRRETGHSDEFRILRNWMGYLNDDIDRKGLALEKELQEELNNRINTVTREGLEPTLRPFARRIATDLQNKATRAGYGVCLKDIKAPSIIQAAFAIFETAETVCVFTVADYENQDQKQIIESFEEYTGSVRKKRVRLTPLKGPEVMQLVHDRWTIATDRQLEDPFDANGVRDAFDDQGRPVERILLLIEKLLELKAADHRPIDGCWPGNRNLAFSATELPRKVRILDREGV